MGRLGLWVGVLLLAACEVVPQPTPVAETLLPTLAPSPTVLPLVPAENPNSFVGRSDPTAAALAAEGEPDQDIAPVAQATEAVIPLMVVVSDGTVLRADFYGAPQRPAAAVLVLGQFEPLASTLQAAGYHVMRLPDANTHAEITAALDTLRGLPVVSEIGVVVTARDAQAAQQACAEQGICRALLVVDPALFDPNTILDSLKRDL